MHSWRQKLRRRRSRLRRLADAQAGPRSTFIMSSARVKAMDAIQRNTRTKTPVRPRYKLYVWLNPHLTKALRLPIKLDSFHPCCACQSLRLLFSSAPLPLQRTCHSHLSIQLKCSVGLLFPTSQLLFQLLHLTKPRHTVLLVCANGLLFSFSSVSLTVFNIHPFPVVLLLPLFSMFYSCLFHVLQQCCKWLAIALLLACLLLWLALLYLSDQGLSPSSFSFFTFSHHVAIFDLDFIVPRFPGSSLSLSYKQTTIFFVPLSLSSSVCFVGSHPSSRFPILDRTVPFGFIPVCVLHQLHTFNTTLLCVHLQSSPRVMSLQQCHCILFFHCECVPCLQPDEPTTHAFHFLSCTRCSHFVHTYLLPSCVLTAMCLHLASFPLHVMELASFSAQTHCMHARLAAHTSAIPLFLMCPCLLPGLLIQLFFHCLPC